MNFLFKNNIKIIAWWSGGVTSAVACWIAIQMYGIENVRIIFIDTFNEDDDTYRFKDDCAKWYGKEIESISAIPEKYNNIREIWVKYLGLNFAHGAICSSELKREVRIKFQKENDYDYQIFGFDIDEPKRAKGMAINYPEALAVYPLLYHALTKKNCIDMILEAGIKIPVAYLLGFSNNNCLKTGCVRGGIGYWQLMFKIKLEVYEAMAELEHYLTDLKGEPVTLMKDQSNEAKQKVKDTGNKNSQLIFLKKHKDYPNNKTVMEMKGRKPKPLMDCNGLGCSIDDLQELNTTVYELNDSKQNYQRKLF